MPSRRFFVSVFVCRAVVCIAVMAISICLNAQSDEQKLIDGIYAKTQTAKSAADYSAILDACEIALQSDLSAKNQKYVKTLMAWSHSRRGDLRLEVSNELRKVGNQSQADNSLDQADSDYTAAIELNQDRWQAWQGRAFVHVKRGQLEQAVEIFTKVCEMAADQTNAFFNRAEVLYQLEDFESALADYNRVISQNASDVQGLTGRAHCHVGLGNRDAALADLEVVCRLLPDNGMARVNRGDLHAEMGNERLALVDYEKAIQCGCTLARLRFANLQATSTDPSIFDLDQAEKHLSSLSPDDVGDLALVKGQLVIANARRDAERVKELETRLEKVQQRAPERSARAGDNQRPE
ncbi:MAG: tetratricopeptide repeat protein [Pirellulaceae bacterium]|nr:tetratricopeptide repeat protein [Pirellulaceae bacterium]